MINKNNWDETKKRFTAWWNGNNIDRPIMKIVACDENPMLEKPLSPKHKYLDVDYIYETALKTAHCSKFYAESFPNINLNIGPGSMAIYLGSTPNFSYDTVWYDECVEDFSNYGGLKYDADNYWFKKHFQLIKELYNKSNKDFLINIPDIIENLDILASLRGTEKLLFDLMDTPEIIEEYISYIDDLYFIYYDAFYNCVKNEDNSSSFTAFEIWGPGKVSKIQCDFSAMISPDQFRKYVLPSLTKQCNKLDFSLYHLDGPDAIRHLPALMEIENLNALQWTAGAGQPDGGSEKWYGIYKEVISANKSLHIRIYDGEYKDWLKAADKIVNKFGPEKLYLLLPTMTTKQAENFIQTANDYWTK